MLPLWANQGNVDYLIQDIPSPENAIGNFNGAAAHAPPFRDIPPVLIAHVGNPIFSAQEPNWAKLMDYFPSSPTGEGNLQDFYMFLTRIAIPSTIIENRQLLLRYYTAFPSGQQNLRLRYDTGWSNDYVAPENEYPRPPHIPNIPPRTVLGTGSTPKGTNFVMWLNSALAATTTGRILLHRPTQLDMWLAENEIAVRRMHSQALLARTVKVLRIFWWLSDCNRTLEGYERDGWIGMQKEVV